MDKLRLIFSAILLFALNVSGSVEEQTIIVDTKLGSYGGFVRKSTTNKLVQVFYGIPYAEPPIGSNRFKPPLPVKPHNGTIDCTEIGAPCMQKVISLIASHPVFNYYFGLGHKKPNEDCLFLNLYIPKNGGTHLPVMVWIHGGGFVMGSANAQVYDASTLAVEADVLVVTLNYRLSSLGFLYLGMDGAPGNAGLMDQAMALRWVRDHISAFGGDPERITLFGESAGAASVGHHILLESSRPLFQRAILESGVAHMPGGVDSRKNQLEAAFLLADNLGCPFNVHNLAPTLNCFLSKDDVDIVENEPVDGYANNLFFKPVVDGQYVKEHPELTVRNGLSSVNMDVLLGCNQDEASLFLVALSPFIFTFTEKVKVDERDLRELSRLFFGVRNDSVILDMVFTLYKDFQEKDSNTRFLKTAIRAGTEGGFYCSLLQFEDAMLNASNKVFKYRFNQRTEDLDLPKWMGVTHGAELNYVFGEPLDPNKNFDSASKMLSRRMIRYWANFARTGDPNISPSDAPTLEWEGLPFWQPLNSEEGNYLNLDNRSPSTGFYNRGKCHFWNEIFREIYRMEGQKPISGKPSLFSVEKNRFYI